LRPANVAHLFRIRLRSRLVPELLALTGIAVGVALVFAALVASTSLSGSVREITRGIVGDADFQLTARSSAGLNQRILPEVQRIDGVSAVAPVAEVRANLVGPNGFRPVLLVGADPRFAQVGGPLLQPHVRAGRKASPGLVLPAPLADNLGIETGETVRVETGSGVARIRIAGLVDRDDVGSLVESPVALAPLGLVQAVAGMDGHVSRIFVEAAPGSQRDVDRALGQIAGNRLDTATANQEVAVFERAAYPTNQSTALFSVLSALVGFLFALNAMLLTVPQRRHLIADLRMAGYEPWVVVQLLLFDALVLGVIGSVLGLALGDQASRLLFDEVPGYLTSAFAIGSQRIITWQSIAIACTCGVLAACIAVLAPVRDALARTTEQPVALARASGRDAWLSVGGAASLAVTIAIAIFSPWAALAGIGTLALSLLLFMPVLMRLAAATFDLVGRQTRSPVAILAVLELRSGSARIRTLALAATGAIAVFATVSIGGARADLQRGLDAVAEDVDKSAEVWVAFRGPANIFGTTSFVMPPDRIAAIERLPAVRRVAVSGGSFLDVGDYRAWVLAPPPSAHPVLTSQVQEGNATLANTRVGNGGWLVLSESIAEHLDVGVGDRIVLPAPVPTSFRVAALSTNNGWPGGGIVMNAADYARAWDTAAPSVLGIEVEDGAAPAQVVTSIRRLLGPGTPLRTETSSERMQRQQATSRSGLARLNQISTMVLIAAVLAMAASMAGMIWQRRPTLAALKLHGAGEFELWRSLLLESGLLLGTGCLIGAIFGLIGQVLLGRALETITGFPVFYSTAGLVAVTIFGLVTAVAMIVLAIPGWLAVRVPPTAGISR
jgi:putative ABC transport system permease protein